MNCNVESRHVRFESQPYSIPFDLGQLREFSLTLGFWGIRSQTPSLIPVSSRPGSVNELMLRCSQAGIGDLLTRSRPWQAFFPSMPFPWILASCRYTFYYLGTYFTLKLRTSLTLMEASLVIAHSELYIQQKLNWLNISHLVIPLKCVTLKPRSIIINVKA